jgi:PAS domain S-box-containing protein
MPDWVTQNELYRYQVRQAAQSAMFVMDVNGVLLTWNAGVEELLGFSEEEWLGQHAAITFTPADKAQDVCEAELRNAAEQGYSSDVRWHRRKDQTELFAHGFITALRDDSGALLGFSKILSDETKSKQLQDSLTESNMALEKFAYVASHDLQEPLRTVGVFTEVIAQRYRGKLDDEATRLLDQVVGGVRRMSAMIEDLLTYARVQTEVNRPSSFSLDQDFETALSLLQAQIDESNATVTHDPLPSLEVDQGEMVRLFQNLIGNALKYRKKEEPPVVHASVQKESDAWVITLTDNGIGFDPKHATEIFLPFRRLHSSEYPGTGVGLAICRRIVENHGGRIWANSKPGDGTSFHFTLPHEPKKRNVK